MRSTFFASVCLILTPILAAPAAEQNVRLTGIVNLPGYKKAVLQDSIRPEGYFLGEGERDGEIEVKTISPVDLTVTLAQRTNRDLKLTMEAKTDQSASSTPTIILEKADFRSVVPIFQKLCNRTLLQHPQTPDPTFTFHSSAVNPADALHDLQIAFTNNGLVMIPDGDKFLMVGPSSATSMLIPRSAQTTSAQTSSNLQSTNAENHAQESLPAGTLDFRGADLNQAFELYGMLIAHPMDRSHGIRGPARGEFYILTQTPLSKAEAIYAISTLINWRGVNVVTQSDGSITGVPSAR
jgi:hypothetical protein